MMEFNIFADEVVNRLQKVLGIGYNVSIRTYSKNNGIKVRYICISADGEETAHVCLLTIIMDCAGTGKTFL